ncbi:MAG: VOC family protein [Rhizobiaceae bacterium]|nr:VOC family protein [Rhizobiaceae bacterium]
MTEITPSRALDHLVLPVTDIDVARRRYQQLGFTVAPDGRHPFGTENCCIFFNDGTFLEPLGVAQRETCEEKAVKGNTFVANDQTFRFRRGDEGFSHLVVKSDDAKADHQLYRKQGISGGRMVRFSRRFEGADGSDNKVAFALAFAGDQRSPDSGFFSCQVVASTKADRGKLLDHENGVTGLKEVILSEVNPTDFQYFFQTYLNQREMDVDSFGMSFDAAGSKVSVFSPDGMSAFYGMDCRRRERGMLFEAFVLAVKDLKVAAELLKSRQISHRGSNDRLIIPPVAGQGTTLILEEA